MSHQTFCQCGHPRQAHEQDHCVFCSTCSGFQFKVAQHPTTGKLMWWEQEAINLHNKLKPYIKDMEDQDNEAHTIHSQGNIIQFEDCRKSSRDAAQHGRGDS